MIKIDLARESRPRNIPGACCGIDGCGHCKRAERLRIASLCFFPREDRIKYLIARKEDKPPAKWIQFGVPGDSRPLAAIESRAWFEWRWHHGYDGRSAERPPIPRALRAAVIDRDGFVCRICFADVDMSDIHLDHIVPHSRGGPTTLDNLRVTHSVCNMRKGARLP